MPITVDDFRFALAEFTKRPAPPVTAEDTPASLQLDSLAMLEIIGVLEDRHDVDEENLADQPAQRL